LRWAALRTGKRCFSLCVDQFVTPSDYVRHRLLHEGVPGGRVTTVRNGVNLDRFRSDRSDVDVRSKYGLPRDSTLIASVSTVIPEKGVDYLIEAASLAVAQGANVSFIHAGEGQDAERCRARVRELGLQGRFVLAGHLDQPEITALLQQCDIFSLPCTWGEAFSLAILEAIAAGKPAIVTAVGGNPEAVEDGRNGILVPPHDAPALAAAILSLIDDPERRRAMARASEARASEFDVERWVEETIELYESLAPAVGRRRPERARAGVSG
jgi:2-deoxystreptamine N-acetyl-D-glucosaminyltransferase/2-deoxystreptamine glucosyltransferase